MPGEPHRWFARLCEYCLLGSGRTLEGSWRIETKGSKRRLPGAWRRASQRWHWAERAAKFDEARHTEQVRELETMRRQERERRRLIVIALGTKVENLIDVDSSPVRLAALARVYFEASRAEFGAVEADLPQPQEVEMSSEEFQQIIAQVNASTG